MLRLLRTQRLLLRELAIAFPTLLVYFLARGGIHDRAATARRNAKRIVTWEKRMGLHWEPALNRWTARDPRRRRLLNAIYFWMHMPLIVPTGIWLLHRKPDTYRITRDAFFGSAVAALFTYRLLPVAPPRLMDDHDFVDTMQEDSKVSYQAQSLGPFVNPYAAVPSLHFGWSLLLSAGFLLAQPRRRRIHWLAAGLQPAVMFISIVGTANHWVLDAVAGALAAALGLGGAWLRGTRNAGHSGGR